jgi:predicted membrane channel-forming protein YqfA (hemolysin III family)
MSRPTLNYLVGWLMFLLLLGIAFVGLLLRFAIPSGGRGPQPDKWLWGLHRQDWATVHFYLALAFLVVLVIHLVLHWSWIVTCTRTLFRRRSAAPCDRPDDAP